MSRVITYAQAINDGLQEAMVQDEGVICYGLGVPDPKGVFGTTLGLQERFGAQRVFDMPCSENAMTGVAIGAALNGIRPVMTHQRLDFFLLAMDQLVNNAAKWHYMFGGQHCVPLTIRLILGRGWGQGPTHSQNLQAWFAHIPGLKVVMPTTPADAKGLLIEAIFDPNPVLYLEHRWLHNSRGDVPEGDHRTEIGRASVLRRGNDLTVVAMSYMTVEARRAVDCVSRQGMACDLIDLRTISPLDFTTVMDSVSRTGHLLVLDTGPANGSVAGEIIARVSMERWDSLKSPPRRLALPDVPMPTSHALTGQLYPRANDVATTIAEMLDKDVDLHDLAEEQASPLDVPGDWFTGPF